MKTWDELKAQGSDHYKSGSVEPIDLYRSAGAFRDFALCSIIKYAYRNFGKGLTGDPAKERDMRKIIHYAELIIAACSDHIPDAAKMVAAISDTINGERPDYATARPLGRPE